jgi:predicted glycosyltransferase
MRIVTGPFLPEAEWLELNRRARDQPGVELVRHVPDMAAEMRRARLSISQFGYNTALDIVVAGVPALVVPYAAPGENEQTRRAEALAGRGVVRHLPAALLDAAHLAAAIGDALNFAPRPAALALEGAQRTAELLAALLPRPDRARIAV